MKTFLIVCVSNHFLISSCYFVVVRVGWGSFVFSRGHTGAALSALRRAIERQRRGEINKEEEEEEERLDGQRERRGAPMVDAVEWADFENARRTLVEGNTRV